MAHILTNVTAQHEHYLTGSFSVTDFVKVGTLALTATGAVTGQTISNLAATLPTFGANTKLFVQVDSLTDIPAALKVTLKNSTASIGEADVVPHAPINALFPIQNAGSWAVAPTAGFTVDITGAAPGVVLNILMLDDDASKWFDLGLNYNEGLSWQDGALTAPVARGWNLTDHAKRIPTGNQWSIAQLYCSQFEGIAGLSGKSLMIKDEIHTDGGATIKETIYLTKASVQDVARAIGGGGGQAGADAVHASGYYAKSYTHTADAIALTATTN